MSHARVVTFGLNDREPTPYPMELSDNEDVTALAARDFDFFPDCLKYPPPIGVHDTINGCGCLYTTWQDRINGGNPLRLETIWQPIYDTQYIPPGHGTHLFFQNPNGRGYAHTNVPTSGCLTWPKKFHMWELELTVGNDALADCWRRHPSKSPYVVMQIGEKAHLTLPFISLYAVPTRCNTFVAPLPLPLYIPSVQNFHVRIETPSEYDAPTTVAVRCALNGYLHREIP